jgi:hypothetical protein
MRRQYEDVFGGGPGDHADDSFPSGVGQTRELAGCAAGDEAADPGRHEPVFSRL